METTVSFAVVRGSRHASVHMHGKYCGMGRTVRIEPRQTQLSRSILVPRSICFIVPLCFLFSISMLLDRAPGHRIRVAHAAENRPARPPESERAAYGRGGRRNAQSVNAVQFWLAGTSFLSVRGDSLARARSALRSVRFQRTQSANSSVTIATNYPPHPLGRNGSSINRSPSPRPSALLSAAQHIYQVSPFRLFTRYILSQRPPLLS